MHYPDLQSLFDVYPELRKITESQHFRDRWQSYNIHIKKKKIDTVTPSWALVETDRLGRKHGTTRVEDCNGVLWKTAQFVNNLQQGIEIEYRNYGHYGPCKTYWHQGQRQGTSTCCYPDGSVYLTHMYINNEPTGVRRSYNTTTIIWDEWANGDLRHGKDIQWYDCGSRKSEKTWVHGILRGIHKRWDRNGKLTHKCFHTTSTRCSLSDEVF
jgi:antitoxin component YwqK of YwqJK toxin-antitoxin module